MFSKNIFFIASLFVTFHACLTMENKPDITQITFLDGTIELSQQDMALCGLQKIAQDQKTLEVKDIKKEDFSLALSYIKSSNFKQRNTLLKRKSIRSLAGCLNVLDFLCFTDREQVEDVLADKIAALKSYTFDYIKRPWLLYSQEKQQKIYQKLYSSLCHNPKVVAQQHNGYYYPERFYDFLFSQCTTANIKPIHHLTHTSDGKHIVMSYNHAVFASKLIVVDASTLRVVRELPEREEVKSIAFRPQSNSMIVVSGKKISVWDVKKWSKIQEKTDYISDDKDYYEHVVSDANDVSYVIQTDYRTYGKILKLSKNLDVDAHSESTDKPLLTLALNHDTQQLAALDNKRRILLFDPKLKLLRVYDSDLYIEPTSELFWDGNDKILAPENSGYFFVDQLEKKPNAIEFYTNGSTLLEAKNNIKFFYKKSTESLEIFYKENILKKITLPFAPTTCCVSPDMSHIVLAQDRDTMCVIDTGFSKFLLLLTNKKELSFPALLAVHACAHKKEIFIKKKDQKNIEQELGIPLCELQHSKKIIRYSHKKDHIRKKQFKRTFISGSIGLWLFAGLYTAYQYLFLDRVTYIYSS